MSTASSNRICIGITMGDPSGVGPEVIAKAIKHLKLNSKVKFLIIGDKFVLSKFIKSLPKNCELLDLNNVPRKNFQFGKKSLAYGKASFEYLRAAISLAFNNEIAALITAPINKDSIKLAGFKWPGHTEFLADSFKAENFAMMFVADKLKVTLATIHIPFKQVPLALTADKIFQAISLSHKYLKDYFKIKIPKIAVCGLNPHAGENGLTGREEQLIIYPAVKKANAKFANISGPYPADTIFHSAISGKFDAVIAMYHDQAMIPVKTLFFDKVVNFTLGLPFIRTSPAHGTAFDIAGKNIADPSSMTEAIKLAVNLTLKKQCCELGQKNL